jgi:hypothetical protein
MMRVALGQVVATPGVLALCEELDRNLGWYIARHQSGDWGCVNEEDKALNDAAISNGTRVFSAYQLDAENKIWIITEADRSVTTALLPSEY